MPHGHSAVIVDRDGVIDDETNYVTSWEMFRFIPGALEALRRLREAGWLVLMATNQSAVGQGLMTRETLDDIHRRMNERIEQAGGRIERVYVCPHHPDEGCSCRKPEPGMLLQAISEWDLDPQRCYFIGDSWRDVEAGRRAGCVTILTEGVREDRGRRELERLSSPPDFFVRDLAEAVDLILRRDEPQSNSSTRSG
ncbi:MAG: HAD family hydrolase [Armatimonadetes bacterium]|nr:HAD family hydrolase [Armatimonadota bacterium]